MPSALLLLCLLNFLFIGSLPLVFFKRHGRLGLWWWLTAAPYVLCVALLLAASLHLVSPVTDETTTLSQGLRLGAVVCSAASIALIAFTLGTHRRRLALWHQTNDAPEHLVTYGAYSRLRHPFYAAFLLALLAALLACPHLGTAATFVYGLGIMNYTAAQEERRLCASAQFGAAYRDYMQHTGRFWPRWRRYAS
jgi:protein-S-isoprenylcysteine O-methyltransferase Ste14